jgi:Histidine phosphatase superfamily (branch 2)
MSVAINRRTTSSTTPGGTHITKSTTTTSTNSRRAYLVVLIKSSLKFIMIAMATRTFVKQFRQVADATTTHSSALRASTSSFKNNSRSSSNKVFRRVQVQVIHRHGDRSPITPLQDEAYWQSQLIPETTLTKIAQHTRLKTGKNNSPNTHTAQGRGPFGKLTELGLLQMVQVGSELREQLVDTADHHHHDHATTILEEHSGHQLQPFLFTRQRPFHPQQHLRVYSTNFPRTIQSVQGLLI